MMGATLHPMKSNVFYRIPIEQFRQIVSECTSISQVFLRMNLCRSSDQYRPFREAVADLGISTAHFKGQYTAEGFSPKKSNEEIFVTGGKSCATTVKRALKAQNLIPYRCETPQCQNSGEWLGSPLSLQLDHRNGDNTDNRLENLRWLCPNCHTQTKTYAGKRHLRKICPDCGGRTSTVGVRCRKCYERSIDGYWPTPTALKELVWTLPMWKLANQLGHSKCHLAIYCNENGVPLPPKGYWQKRAWGYSHEEALAPKPVTDRRYIPSETAAQMRQMRSEGKSCRKIAKELGFHHTSVARACRNGASQAS